MKHTEDENHNSDSMDSTSNEGSDMDDSEGESSCMESEAKSRSESEVEDKSGSESEVKDKESGLEKPTFSSMLEYMLQDDPLEGDINLDMDKVYHHFRRVFFIHNQLPRIKLFKEF